MKLILTLGILVFVLACNEPIDTSGQKTEETDVDIFEEQEIVVESSEESEDILYESEQALGEVQAVNDENEEVYQLIDNELQQLTNYIDIVEEAYVQARSDWMNYGEGNYPELRNEIINQWYQDKKNELENIESSYSQHINREQKMEITKLKSRLEKLFRHAYEMN